MDQDLRVGERAAHHPRQVPDPRSRPFRIIQNLSFVINPLKFHAARASEKCFSEKTGSAAKQLTSVASC